MVLNISNIALKDASMAGFYEMPDLLEYNETWETEEGVNVTVWPITGSSSTLSDRPSASV